MLIQNDNAGDWQSQQSAVWTPAPAAELEVWTSFAPESDLFAEAPPQEFEKCSSNAGSTSFSIAAFFGNYFLLYFVLLMKNKCSRAVLSTSV